MTYFGKQKLGPLGTQDKMASDRARLAEPRLCENWGPDNSFWECIQHHHVIMKSGLYFESQLLPVDVDGDPAVCNCQKIYSVLIC